jgi:AP-3 complex subunit beta
VSLVKYRTLTDNIDSLDDSHLPALIDILQTLLRDRSPLTLGAVATAFDALCSTRLDLLHQHYRRLCRMLVDADEWGQIDLLNLLVRYARTMLLRPTSTEVDVDVSLLVRSAEPLLQSKNPAVVLAVVRATYYLGQPSDHSKFVRPLMRLLDVSPEVERAVITSIAHIARQSPVCSVGILYLQMPNISILPLTKATIC